MQTFFVQIKCALGRTYEVASALAEAEIASEIYSTAGDFDILAKFYVERDVDIGHFVGHRVQAIPRHRRHAHDHHLQGVLNAPADPSQEPAMRLAAFSPSRSSPAPPWRTTRRTSSTRCRAAPIGSPGTS